MRPWFAVALLVALCAATGCGKSGPKMIEVTGTVKYDGKEIPDGDIRFIPEDKSIGPEEGKIKDGKYAVKVREGKNRVEISASRAVPGKKGPMGTEDLIESYIPEKYNSKTTLSAEVGAGKTEHNFDLMK
jgi:hypothetical protein